MVSGTEAAKKVEVNGTRLQYVEQGSGEPIVFVHGAPHDLRAWEPVREVNRTVARWGEELQHLNPR